MLYPTGYSSNNNDKLRKEAEQEEKKKRALEKDRQNRTRRADRAKQRELEKWEQKKTAGWKRIDQEKLAQARAKEIARRKEYKKRDREYRLEYTEDWCRSREVTSKKGKWCEWCELREWTDIDHNRNSYRGKRKHNKDWTDIILLCRVCHEHKHAHDTQETRETIAGIILDKIMQCEPKAETGK